jgi:hypothetical protein
MGAKSAFGKNNWDRLEAAGVVGTEDTTSSQKEKLTARASELRILAQKFDKIFAGMADTFVMERPRQLKRIQVIIAKVRELHDTQLPVGAKRHVATCINELTSIREGVHALNAAADKKMLTMIAAKEAKTELLAMAVATEARIEKIEADSSMTGDMEEFYKKAEEVIKKHSGKAEDLKAIKDKAYMLVRLPVVPADEKRPSAERLAMAGFQVESLGGYPVLQNQLVLGINPRAAVGEHSGEVSGVKASKLIRAEAERLRKMLEKKTGQQLNFVSDTAYSHGSGTWFWLMSDKDINRLAKVSPGNRVQIQRWGFAFR